MRSGIFAVLLLAGCTADNPLFIGDADGGGPGGGDGAIADGSVGHHDQASCGSSCQDFAEPRDFAAGTPDLSELPPDLAPHQCTPTCNNHCTSGACCPGAPNGGCCGQGEWCDNGACRCGDQPACGNGDRCSSGVIMFNQCGTVCCGSFGHPCPL